MVGDAPESLMSSGLQPAIRPKFATRSGSRTTAHSSMILSDNFTDRWKIGSDIWPVDGAILKARSPILWPRLVGENGRMGYVMEPEGALWKRGLEYGNP